MTDLTKDELIDVFEKTLRGQLRALRSMRKKPAGKSRQDRGKKSNIDVIEAVLRTTGAPLHIDQIIEKAHKLYSRRLHRESIVSALTKKILDQQTFCRVGRNVFALLEWEEKKKDGR
jgi:hypothetical protein